MRKGRSGRRFAGLTLVASLAVSLPPSVTHARDARDSQSSNVRTVDRTAAPLPPTPPTTAASAPPATEANLDLRGMLGHVTPIGRLISDKLRALVTSDELDKRVNWAPDREAVERFYAARDYAPVWISDGAFTARAKAAIARLQAAAAEGLDPADYPAPKLALDATPETVAEAELTLTNSVLDLARHMAIGRIAPRRVVPQIEYGSHTPDPADILKTITQARDIDAAFAGYDPSAQDFQALKAKLADLRRPRGDEGARIPDGPMIKPGSRDPRVPALRARFHVGGKSGDTRYDRALYHAVRRFQREHQLRDGGTIGPDTLAAINGPSRVQVIETIEANMERWRWLPRDLGDTYVMVNVPDYSLKVVHDHRVVWRTKIVVGKPTTPTPLVSAPMRQVIVNPSWYVPQSIIENELLPAYQNDPNIFDRMGLQMKKGPDGHITVVQPPGAANALGRIKFVFPNKFQVYLHDTPQKRLFSHDKRAFSHGCMRVQDPTKFGEVMLSLAMNERTPNSRQLSSMFGHAEHDFKLVKQPMVHLTYQTAFVDDDGKLQLRDDIYGFDQRIHTILHSKERRIADVPPPPDPKRDQATLKSSQEILRRVERREAQNPVVFFDRLFR